LNPAGDVAAKLAQATPPVARVNPKVDSSTTFRGKELPDDAFRQDKKKANPKVKGRGKEEQGIPNQTKAVIIDICAAKRSPADLNILSFHTPVAEELLDLAKVVQSLLRFKSIAVKPIPERQWRLQMVPR